MDEVQHNFKTVEGVRMHYVTSEPVSKSTMNNFTVLLLAGFPESCYAWRKVITILKNHCTFVAIDLPGQGDSDKPAEGYDTQALAKKVHGLIKLLGLSVYYLAAHDVGAWVAFTYAALFSEEVAGMALLDAAIPGVTLPDLVSRRAGVAWRTWHFPFHTVPDLPELLIRGKERIYLEWFLRRKAAKPTIFSEKDIDEYERILMQPGSLRASLAYYRACEASARQNQTLVKNGKVDVNVMAISSDQGTIPNMAQPLKEFVFNVQEFMIKDCGHYIPEEQPGELASLLRTYFHYQIS